MPGNYERKSFIQTTGEVGRRGYLHIVEYEANRPSSNLNEGDLCYCLDTDKLYKAISNNSWAEITSNGAVAWDDITGKPSTFTPSSHSHPISDVTSLQSSLDGKSATSHNHDATYEAKNANIQAHIASAHAPSDAQKNSDITKAEIEAKLTGSITSHSHPGGITTLKKTGDQTINAGAGVFTDITDLTFPVANGVDYAFFFYIAFQSAATATGWKAGINCPNGTLDFWAESQTVANAAAGAATHTERHNTSRDDMTLLTSTVTQGVDLAIRIEGRYKCTQDGTLAARFANELGSNTNIVVQKGSYGWYF